MIRFKITVRMTDTPPRSRSEQAADAGDSHARRLPCVATVPRPEGRGTVDSCGRLVIRPVGRAHRAAVLSAGIQVSLRSRLPALARPRLIM